MPAPDTKVVQDLNINSIPDCQRIIKALLLSRGTTTIPDHIVEHADAPGRALVIERNDVNACYKLSVTEPETPKKDKR